MTLTKKLTFAVTAVITALLVVISIIVDYQFNTQINDSLNKRMNTLTYTIGTMLLEDLISSGGEHKHLASGRNVLRKVVRDQPDIAKIVIRNTDYNFNTQEFTSVIWYPNEEPRIPASDVLVRSVPIQLNTPSLYYGFVEVTFDISSYRAAQQRILMRVIFLGVACGLLAFMVVFYIARSIVRPIRELRDGTNEFGKERYDTRVSITSNDEVGQLARTFNDMADRIDKQIKRVRTLQVCSRQIAGELEQEHVVSVSADAFAKIAGVSKMSIMLLDETKDELEIVGGMGLHNDAKNFVALRRGEGIAGRVIENGKSIYIEDLGESDLYHSHSGSKPTGQIFALPLIVKGRCFGVINLHEKSDNSKFDASDKSILTTLTEIVAVAIENARLYDMAITDGLTKLYIVRYFHQRLDEEIIRTHRTAQPLSLIMTDLDHFKSVNDTYGHQSGDAVLVALASIIIQIFREIDICCRYGGEEFAIILPNTDKAGAIIVAERLREAVEQYDFSTATTTLSLSISCGTTTYKMGMSKNDLVHEADSALYKSKRDGRNRCTHHEDMG
ncbi:MAG: diguanylate cyclase [Candidatus Lindowbacteria bacterium]|nr:diguanylate cyclase [Candidatus Lindowbacteria bacterium]